MTWERVDLNEHPTAICIAGSIINELPLYAGNYDQADQPSLLGLLDEIRLSNYAKRDFEVAGSARPYSAYTHLLGREVAMRSWTASEQYSYDLEGNLVSVNKETSLRLPDAPPVEGQYLARTAYDNLGRASSLRYPDGEVVVSRYDIRGTEIGLTGYGDFAGPSGYGRQPYLTEADVTPTGKLARLLFGNGVETMFAYDEGPTKNPNTGRANANGTFGNELLSRQITTLPDGQTLQDQYYEYDQVGNLLKRADFSEQTGRTPPLQHTAPLTSVYTYDGLSRLTGFETRFGSSVAMQGNYSYDPNGNLRTKEGAALTYAAPGAANCGRPLAAPLPHAVTRLTQAGLSTDYCYDANGRLVETRRDGTTLATYAHNVPGKLSQITNAAGTFRFTYDGNGQRIYKVEPAGITIEPFSFYRVTPQGIEKFYQANGRRLARRTGPDTANVFWYHPEHLGSTNFMTDAAGAELQDAYSEYTPFGAALPTQTNNTSGAYAGQNTPDSAPDRSGGFQFTGKELDDTGLYYYEARYYDPTIGRFIEPDPLISGISSQALNRYSYVLNNPTKYIDPTGNSKKQALLYYIDTGDSTLNIWANWTPLNPVDLVSGPPVAEVSRDILRRLGASEMDIETLDMLMVMAGNEAVMMGPVAEAANSYLTTRLSIARARLVGQTRGILYRELDKLPPFTSFFEDLLPVGARSKDKTKIAEYARSLLRLEKPLNMAQNEPYIYAVDEANNIIIAPRGHATSGQKHTQLTQGGTAKAAGEIMIDQNGTVIINSQTGRYVRQSPDAIKPVQQALESVGYEVKKIDTPLP